MMKQGIKPNPPSVRRLLVASLATAFLLGACNNKTREVTRVDPARVRDLDYRFDDDDVIALLQ